MKREELPDFKVLVDKMINAKDEVELDALMKTVISYGDSAVPALMERFKDGNDMERYRTAWAFSQLQSPADDAMYLMKDALRDSNMYVRYCGAFFIARREELPDTIVNDTLIGAMKNKESARFRYEALIAFRNQRVPPRAAVAPAIALLNDPDSYVRDEAYRTLKHWISAIDTQNAVEALLPSSNRKLQGTAALLLAQTLDKRHVDTSRIEWLEKNSDGLLQREAKRILAREPK